MNMYEKDKSTKNEKRPPLHFASYYYLDKESTKNRVYHGYSTSPEAEKDYQQIIDKKKQRHLIDITSEPLKKEYSKYISYLNENYNLLLILSLLLIVDSFLNLKYLGPSEIVMSILILSSISIAIVFLILINIKAKILVDPQGYVLFYLFSMIQSLVSLFLFMIKILNFIIVFRRLDPRKICRKKYKCPGLFAYLLLLIFSIIIFVGILACIKFTFFILYEGFNIFAMKRKTIFQRQIELNEKKEKSSKIEFVEDDSINNSMNKLNTRDNFKTE